MPRRLSRRTILLQVSGAIAATTGPRQSTARAQTAAPAYSYPLGIPSRPLGDGWYVRIAYAAENARYYPGWWHTAENWHALDDQTAGLPVYAVAAGEVVFAGYDYPGRVIIVRHPDALFSMYGHLDSKVAVTPGELVTRGQMLGAVLARGDDLARSHLHFELRTFLTRNEINGTAPRYGVNCGYQCPPGPGYWPMSAPEHPSQLGWLNPTHVINRRAWPEGIPAGTEVVVCEGAPPRTPFWGAPGDRDGALRLGDLSLLPGNRYPLLAIDAGAEDALDTSAEATRLWHQIALPDGDAVWVQAAIPSPVETGSDGRPSSVRFAFLPVAAP